MTRSLKIWTQGCREPYCQLPRIEEAFRSMGHNTVSDISAADLIYCNNAWYDHIRDNYAKIMGTIVLNVLDLAPHIADFPVDKLREQLRYADVVTTISRTVEADLYRRTGFKSHVIYQPIQKIARHTGAKRYPFKFMFAGRVRDPNKRAMLGIEALRLLGNDGRDVITTGTEFHGFGNYAGLIDETLLNDLYNSVDFLLFPSKEEGIGLPAIEAVAGGAIPVLCNDMSTLKEFFPLEEFADVQPDAQSISKFIGKYAGVGCAVARETFREKLYKHYKENLEEKFSALGVARRIIEAAAPHLETNIKLNRT